jgi:PadR family transcriptional regulator, regulatory protein PadR
MGVNIATREILLGFWKVHILHHASEEPIHGQWVLSELRRHGYEISPGTLYPLLHRLERHGWLRRGRARGTGPRARKEYRLTATGRAALAEVRLQLEELYREVVGELVRKRRRRVGVRRSSLALTRVSASAASGVGSLSSSGGEGRGEEAVGSSHRAASLR